ncbi:hypothetical protein D3C78_1193520 [compost metagenome]
MQRGDQQYRPAFPQHYRHAGADDAARHCAALHSLPDTVDRPVLPPAADGPVCTDGPVCRRAWRWRILYDGDDLFLCGLFSLLCLHAVQGEPSRTVLLGHVRGLHSRDDPAFP